MPEPIQFAIAWAIVICTLGGVGTLFTLARARLRASSHPPRTDPRELAELRDAVHRLAGDVADVQERLDFAERLLAQQRDPERLRPQ